MMLYPDINELLERVDTRYTLVVMVAKRARQLKSGARQLVNIDSERSVSIAVQEVHEDKVGYIRTRDGIK